VTEVVELYVGQVSSPDEVLGVDGRAALRCEDQAAVLVESYATQLLLELTLAVGSEGSYRAGARLTCLRPLRVLVSPMAC